MATIYSWNVNGIRAAERKGFLDWLTTTKPDVLVVQETKAWPEQLSQELLAPKDYYVSWNKAEKKGYSGVAVYSRVEPKAVILDMPDDIANKYHLLDDRELDARKEGRVIVAEFKDIYVSGVYTPNAKDNLARIPLRHKGWDPAYLEYMSELNKKKPVVFLGDLNVAHTEDDLARPKENKGKKGFTLEERQGFDKMLEAGFVDSFRKFHQGNGYYTWWSHFGNARARNTGWRIDYGMVSKKIEDKIKDANIHPDVLGSDHCPVSLELNVKL